MESDRRTDRSRLPGLSVQGVPSGLQSLLSVLSQPSSPLLSPSNQDPLKGPCRVCPHLPTVTPAGSVKILCHHLLPPQQRASSLQQPEPSLLVPLTLHLMAS